VTETAYAELLDLALQSLRLWWKSVGNEGHFTLDPKTVFRPYLAFHWNGVTETLNMVLVPIGLES
jgi:hypothetical protein